MGPVLLLVHVMQSTFTLDTYWCNTNQDFIKINKRVGAGYYYYYSPSEGKLSASRQEKPRLSGGYNTSRDKQNGGETLLHRSDILSIIYTMLNDFGRNRIKSQLPNKARAPSKADEVIKQLYSRFAFSGVESEHLRGSLNKIWISRIAAPKLNLKGIELKKYRSGRFVKSN